MSRCFWCCCQIPDLEEEGEPLLGPNRVQVAARIKEILQNPQCKYCQRGNPAWLQRKKEMKPIPYEEHEKWSSVMLNIGLSEFREPITRFHKTTENHCKSIMTQFENLKTINQHLLHLYKFQNEIFFYRATAVIDVQECTWKWSSHIYILIVSCINKLAVLMELMMRLYKTFEDDNRHLFMYEKLQNLEAVFNTAGQNMMTVIENKNNVLVGLREVRQELERQVRYEDQDLD